MPSTYSNLKIQLMATGENSTTWGDVTNTNLGTAIEEAIAGSADVTFASGDVTLTLSDTNGTQTARNMRLNLIGATGGVTRNLIVPSIEKAYIVNNTCGDAVVVKTAAGTGITVPAGKTTWVFTNATNVVDIVTHLTSLTLGSALPVASGGTGSTSGNASALTGFNASNVSSGTLAVSFGGTGANAAPTARVNLLPSYPGNGGKLLALNAGATDVEWISAGGAGTVTSVNASTAISGLSFSGGPVTSAGTLTLSGTLGVQGGGTGTTSLTSGAVLIGAGTSAVTSVSPGTAANVLTSNGSAWVSQAPSGGGAVSSVTGSGSGISVSPTTGAVVVSNTGVTSIVAGTNVTISGATGAVTINATSASGTFSASDGTAASPSIFFTSDTNTGIFRPTTDTLGFTTGGLRSGFISGASNGSVFIGYNAGGTSSVLTSVAIGPRAGEAITNAGCVFIGNGAGLATTGANNTCIGNGAGSTLTTGAANTIIGTGAQPSTATVSNEITLGSSSVVTLRCQVTTITSLSDMRDKKDIEDLDAGLGFINALRPVQFTWDMRPTEGMDGEVIEGRKGDPDTGFLAQDLKAAQIDTGITIPGLVYDSNPDKLEAGYGKLLPVLVKAIQELSAKVEALEAQLGG